MRLSFAVAIVLLFATLAPAASRQIAPKLPEPPNLRIVHTDHYRIHTDLDRALAQDLARRMDVMYEEYARRLSTFDATMSGGKCDIYLFAKRRDYLAFTRSTMSNSSGLAVPELRLFTADLENQGRDRLRETLQHEAFHLFAHYVIHPDLPPWINEGLAVMFQEGIWTGRMFLLGQVPPRRLRQLQHDIQHGRLMSFATMMEMSLDEWNESLNRDRMQGALNYNQAWAMCHFLVYATENGSPKYRARFLDLLQRLRGGAKPKDAFTAAFSPNIDGFQARFMQWARRLEPSDEATVIERQNILSDMLIQFKKEGRRFDDIESFRKLLSSGQYRMTYTSGDVKWVTDSDPRIYFRTIDGRPYNRDEMLFDLRSGAPLPDLVCSPVGQIKLRTRFYDLPKGQIEHETLVEGGANGR